MFYLTLYGLVAFGLFVFCFMQYAQENKEPNYDDFFAMVCYCVGWGPILIVALFALVFMGLDKTFTKGFYQPLHRFLNKKEEKEVG